MPWHLVFLSRNRSETMGLFSQKASSEQGSRIRMISARHEMYSS